MKHLMFSYTCLNLEDKLAHVKRYIYTAELDTFKSTEEDKCNSTGVDMCNSTKVDQCNHTGAACVVESLR